MQQDYTENVLDYGHTSKSARSFLKTRFDVDTGTKINKNLTSSERNLHSDKSDAQKEFNGPVSESLNRWEERTSFVTFCITEPIIT